MLCIFSCIVLLQLSHEFSKRGRQRDNDKQQNVLVSHDLGKIGWNFYDTPPFSTVLKRVKQTIGGYITRAFSGPHKWVELSSCA